jgi:hypothetical protein
MPQSGAKVNKTQEIVGDLLAAAEKLRMEGQREAACCCIEAVFVLLGQHPRHKISRFAWANEKDEALITH